MKNCPCGEIHSLLFPGGIVVCPQELCRELDLVPAMDPFATPPFAGPLAYFRLHGIGL